MPENAVSKESPIEDLLGDIEIVRDLYVNAATTPEIRHHLGRTYIKQRILRDQWVESGELEYPVKKATN